MASCPKVSICIPSYNHAHYLPAAIESALEQTYRNIEIIIVDDGSTDDSLQISEAYADKYPSLIRVYTHPNGVNKGISATANLAFEKSTGEYWSGLPSDDVLLRNKIEQQVAFLERHPNVGWVYGLAQYMDHRGNLLPNVYGEDATAYPNTVESLITANRIPGMTVLARRKSIERAGPHKEQLLYSDWDFWVRMAAYNEVAFTEKILVKYRVHSYNTSVGIKDDLNAMRALEVMDSLRFDETHKDTVLATPKIKALIDLQRARYHLYLSQDIQAADRLIDCFVTYPSIQDKPSMFLQWLKNNYLSHLNPSVFYPWLIENLPKNVKDTFRMSLTKSLRGITLAEGAMNCYRVGDYAKAREMAVQAQAVDPTWLYDRRLISIRLKTLLGSRSISIAKHVKKRMTSILSRESADLL